MSSLSLDPTFGLDLGYRELWAHNIVDSKKAGGRPAPAIGDLVQAIQTIEVNDRLNGASNVTVTLADPGWRLLDGGFFDANENGKLDDIDVNWPDDSDDWWRLTQVGVDSSSGLSLTFMERVAAELMELKGPVKAARGKYTRAEFLRFLSTRLRRHPVHFHSGQLHVDQPVEKVKLTPSERRRTKSRGINTRLAIQTPTWDGHTYTFRPDELRNAEIVLDEATRLTGNRTAILAVLCACIVEAPYFRNPVGGEGTSSGILQLINSHLGGSISTHGGRRDIPLVVRLFLTKGFAGRGGAIAIAKAHPDKSPGRIAQDVQGSAFPSRYDAVRKGAERVLDAYGGSDYSFSVSYTKQYNFQIGSQQTPHEDYWTGMQRLADEVNWRLFIDGNDIYFDPETQLIRQKPVAVLRRGDPRITNITGTWDRRNIATECSVSVVCDPLEFRAGEVFHLEGFGPFSTGTTSKYPGRWLISETQRDVFDLVTTFTLKQPSAPKREPAPQVGTTTVQGANTSFGESLKSMTRSRTPRQIIDDFVLPVGRANGLSTPYGSPLTPGNNDAANSRHTHLGNASDHAGPPNFKWAADMTNGQHPTPQMDAAAKQLATMFGIPWSGHGLISHTAHGFRFQLIYRYSDPQAGNHFNHVHFGVRVA